MKPSNTLIAREGAREHVYLADFRLTRTSGHDPVTATGQVAGTAAYMAPEVIRGDQPTASPTCTRGRVSQLLKGAARRGGHPIVTHASGCMLRVEAEQLDLRRFELLVRDGHRAIDRCDHEAAVELLDRALALWRGSSPRPTRL